MKGGRYPPQIKFIIGNEACERFSYYGMMGILELYLKDRMQMGDDGATQVLHLFGTAVYFLPLLGGWLVGYLKSRGWMVDLRLTCYLWSVFIAAAFLWIVIGSQPVPRLLRTARVPDDTLAKAEPTTV